MKPLALRLLTVTLLVAALTVACAAAPPEQLVAATETVLLEPWGPDGLQPGFEVTGQDTGPCFAAATTTPRGDAWRCGVPGQDEDGNDVTVPLDPCLRNPADPAGPLACLAYDGQVTLVTPFQALPDTPTGPEGRHDVPLALELANGDVCTVILRHAETITVGGRPLPVTYACDSGGALAGEPDAAGDVWQIAYLPPADESGGTQVVPIARAYRVAPEL